MTDYLLVPVVQIERAIRALERFANDTLLGRNSAHELRELLSAAPAVQGGDWVLVPRTPTDAMLRAAQSAWLDDTLRSTTTMWRAMLAAAPQPPAAVDEAKETDLWRCTICGRVGTVGRCCGEETRERTNLESLQAEIEALRAEVSELRAARIAYASEFPETKDGGPDTGNIHTNIRSLKARAERLAEAIVRADLQIGDGHIEAARITLHDAMDATINKADTMPGS